MILMVRGEFVGVIIVMLFVFILLLLVVRQSSVNGYSVFDVANQESPEASQLSFSFYVLLIGLIIGGGFLIFIQKFT